MHSFRSRCRGDLIQQLMSKIDKTNEAASQAEMKIFDLLQTQTKLQQQSVENEREFLGIFKCIVNNAMSTM